MAAPALGLLTRQRRRRLLQLRAPGPRVAAPNPREMPDSYRRKRRRRRRRAGKEANGAGCSCGRPSSRRGPGPGPSLRTSFPGKFGAGRRFGEPSSGPSCSFESQRPQAWELGALPGADPQGRHALSPLALLLSFPLVSEEAKGNLGVSLPTPNPPLDLERTAAPPTLSTRIWTRPA